MPSPLREQIAHAIERALREADSIPTPAIYPLPDRKDIEARRVLAAVLPLVEAAAAAERQKIDAYIGSAERHFEAGLRRGAAAERSRLHTQLREQITALRRPEPARIGSEAWSQLAARSLRWEGENDMLARVLARVAATPQPEEHDA